MATNTTMAAGQQQRMPQSIPRLPIEIWIRICELHFQVQTYADAKKQLKRIRFVSKDLAYAAAKSLFAMLCVQSQERWLHKRAHRLLLISQSQFAPFVSTVDIDLQPNRTHDFSEDQQDKDVGFCDVEELGRLFQAIESFPNLTTLVFSMWEIQVNEGGAMARCVEHFLLRVLQQPRLTELEICLSPRIELPNMSRLTTLLLIWGCFYTKDSDWTGNPNNYRISLGLKNRHHKVLQSLMNLKHLHFSPGIELVEDGDWLKSYDFPCAQLTELCLNDLHLDASVVTSLVDSNQKLSDCDMSGIVLRYGTWQDVIESLSRLPTLTNLAFGDARLSRYAVQSPAQEQTVADNRQFLDHEADEGGGIKSHRWQDIHALGDLIRQVGALRKKSCYDKPLRWWDGDDGKSHSFDFYRELVPLEDVMVGRAAPGDTLRQRETWTNYSEDAFGLRGEYDWDDRCWDKAVLGRQRSSSCDNPLGHPSSYILNCGPCQGHRLPWLMGYKIQGLQGRFGPRGCAAGRSFI